MKALVTGATGFIGSAVSRRLLMEGIDVRALVRRNSDRQNILGLDVEMVEGDLGDEASLARACRGCDALFHVAADYRLWARRPNEIYQSNVEGTRAILRAAAAAGVGRVVYTSSVATLDPPGDGVPGDEASRANFAEIVGHYKRSKFMAEEVVREFERKGLPVVIVNPSAPVGPRDIKPTPTGRTVLEAAAGRMPAYVDTGLNIVHVDDVAEGHWLAFQRGRVGETYVLGGTNMTLCEILTNIAELVGGEPPKIRLPYHLVLPIAYASEAGARLTGKSPVATVEGVKLSRKMMFFSSEKAKRELGYAARPSMLALQDAVHWFHDNGYLRDRPQSRREKMRIGAGLGCATLRWRSTRRCVEPAPKLMAPIPRYSQQTGPAVLSAGFRPFFLFAAVWAFFVVPASVAFIPGAAPLPSAFAPNVWHAHEMAFGYGGAVAAGFLLTAIPNWTGRLPLQGGPLAALVILWLCGRLAVLFSSAIGVPLAAFVDLAFPAVFLAVVAREIVVGRNWRNLPMVGALGLLFIGNALTHCYALGLASTVDIGNRLGVATLLMLVSLIGGRIVPSFTRNWLVKQGPNAATPVPFDLVDRIALATTVVALLAWAVGPEMRVTPWLALLAGGALTARLARWRGEKTLAEPLLSVLHLGYGWLSFGLLLLGLNGLAPLLPPTSALHALTVGAIGTMTLAVMTRASLGHTGRALIAGPRTTAIYVMITLAALLRLVAPLLGAQYFVGLSLAAVAWCGAFGGFALFYFPTLTRPRVGAEGAPPI